MQTRRHPEWLKVKIPSGQNYADLKRLMRDLKLHTVCEEARCPNIGECWEHRAATIMLLGEVCTRACGFCAVKTGRPTELDWAEPERVAKAIESLGLKFAVITSVNRDDLKDGGAAIFAETIRQIRQRVPSCGIEVLIPDFKGDWDALRVVVEAKPDVLNHNVETVPRCYPWVRPQAKYERSLELLRRVKEMDPTMTTKSGLMVGVGEEWGELVQTFRDLHAVGCDLLTIGQYLRPTLQNIPVVRYYEPDEFRALKETAERIGIRHAESGPLVRSSYHAWEQIEKGQWINRSIEQRGSKTTSSPSRHSSISPLTR
jgi:lipoic acid synthetase